MLRIARSLFERDSLTPCALTVLTWCLSAASALASNDPADNSAVSAQSSEPTVLLLPVISFRADASGDDLFDALQSAGAFAHLSKDAPGSPIQLRVYHSVHPANMDAKNFFSGLASVATLGLSPIVMSGEHTMHYEIYVNGQRISRYEYSAKLSRSEPGHGTTADPTHGLGPDGVVWAKSTVDMFMKDLRGDAPLHALGSEYQTYFGPKAPAEHSTSTSP